MNCNKCGEKQDISQGKSVNFCSSCENKTVLQSTPSENVNLSAPPPIGSIIQFADIDWRVLEIENNKMLIITKDIIKRMVFRNDWEKGNKWENSDIYKYLNGEFIGKFSNNDKAKIVPQSHGHIFLLSVEEAETLFKHDFDREATYKNTPYWWWLWSPTHIPPWGLFRFPKNIPHWWWLRSPGRDNNFAAFVDYDGGVDVYGFYVNDDDLGVRPALWLNIQSFNQWLVKIESASIFDG